MPAMGPYVQRAEKIRRMEDGVKNLVEIARLADKSNDPVKRGEAYEHIATRLLEYAKRFSSIAWAPSSSNIRYADVGKLVRTSTAYTAKAAEEFSKAGMDQRAMDNLKKLDPKVIGKALNPYTKLDNFTREVKRS